MTVMSFQSSYLVQAQKLESIGQLAAGIAHEINTPTQYVSYNTNFLKEQFERLGPLIDKYQALFEVLETKYSHNHAGHDGDCRQAQQKRSAGT